MNTETPRSLTDEFCHCGRGRDHYEDAHRPGQDLMDGGVTAAAIEEEAGAVTCPCGAKGTHYPRPYVDSLECGATPPVQEAKVLDWERAYCNAVVDHHQALAWAHRWKEVARRLENRRRLTVAREVDEALQRAHGAAREAERRGEVLVKRTRERDAAIARAEEAEQERDDNVQSREEMINRLAAALEQARADLIMVNRNAQEVAARAENAEQERDNKAAAYDQLKALFGKAERAAIRWSALAQQPRPLSADDITDEMFQRARERAEEIPWLSRYENADRDPELAAMRDEAHANLRSILVAALTPPPSRPEGHEEWEDELAEMPAADDLTPEQVSRLADALAERDHSLGIHATGVDS